MRPSRGTHVNTVATRAATKAGAFRVFRGIDEVHAAENLGDAPSEFLRVEFKAEPREVATLTGRAGELRNTGRVAAHLLELAFRSPPLNRSRSIGVARLRRHRAPAVVAGRGLDVVEPQESVRSGSANRPGHFKSRRPRASSWPS